MAANSYALHTVPGLETVAFDEVADVMRGARRVAGGRGLVVFTAMGEALPLLRLRTSEDVFAVIAVHPELDPARRGLAQIRGGILAGKGLDDALAIHLEVHKRRVKRITYRVVAQQRGSHAYRRAEVRDEAVRAIHRRNPRWKFVAENAHLEVWLDVQRELGVSMLRLSDRTMRHRGYKEAHIPASLRPTVAAAMVRLAGVRSEDVFVDPLCGAATIPLERMLAGKAGVILAGDISPEALIAARTNASERPRVNLTRWDARALPLPAGCADCVVSNLPFGKQLGSQEATPALYGDVARELARVLKPGGRAVLLTSEPRTLVQQAEGTPLHVVRRLGIELLGQPATILGFERHG